MCSFILVRSELVFLSACCWIIRWADIHRSTPNDKQMSPFIPLTFTFALFVSPHRSVLRFWVMAVTSLWVYEPLLFLGFVCQSVEKVAFLLDTSEFMSLCITHVHGGPSFPVIVNHMPVYGLVTVRHWSKHSELQ